MKKGSMGVSLLLDDFGTGYSSLSYLHRFDFDVLKIDRSFIRRITGNSKDMRIVRGIVHLATDLGMRTVAEGVEDVEHLDRVRELGCHYAQGYLFSKPVPADQCIPLFRAASGRPAQVVA